MSISPSITGRFASERITGLWVARWHLLGYQNVPLFTFQNDTTEPLTLTESNGRRWRPNRRFDKFDFGSVALIFQSSVSPLLSPEAFACHDSGYEFWGLWQVQPDGTDIFVDLPREEIDRICLLDGLTASGVDWYTRQKVHAVVRLVGEGPWERDGLGRNAEREAAMPK